MGTATTNGTATSTKAVGVEVTAGTAATVATVAGAVGAVVAGVGAVIGPGASGWASIGDIRTISVTTTGRGRLLPLRTRGLWQLLWYLCAVDHDDYDYSYAPVDYGAASLPVQTVGTAPDKFPFRRRWQPRRQRQTTNKGPPRHFSTIPKRERPFWRAIIASPCGWRAMPAWRPREIRRFTS